MDHYDVLVVGAGFGGLRMLDELRQLGLSARVLEAGSDVGGTWYWNCYPGARTDSEAWVYAMSHRPELLDEWDWTDRYPRQEEVQRYLAFVADRLDLRRDIQLNTRVDAAIYDEATNRWTVTAENGQTLTCHYLICATGLLSAAYVPPVDGLDSFAGEIYVTAKWPKSDVEFCGKRVAVIGTGATGVQIVPEIAQLADRLLVLQRTPNFVLPGRNHPIDAAQRTSIRRDYPAIWEQSRKHFFGFPMRMPGRVAATMSPDQRRRALEAGWEKGGFRFLFETFDDLLSDSTINEIACKFIRDKIRTIVEDPATADLLCPQGYPLGAKRPPLGHFYYEAFNRDNVELVDVRADPIDRITPEGIRLGSGIVVACDLIVFATGFDAYTGAMTAMDIRGRGGVELRDVWKSGARTALGLAVPGFPNMFMISGPQSTFSNIPLVIDYSTHWIGRAITAMHEAGQDRMEATAEAAEQWTEELSSVLKRPTVTAKGAEVGSWFIGANIPGKPVAPLFHVGGLTAYAAECEKSAAGGFTGFVRDQAPVNATVST